MISIIDYGIGNIASIKNMYKKIGVNARIITDADQLKDTDKLILPGVGAFDTAMSQFRAAGWEQPVSEFVKTGKYVLGICLGMQMMTRSSHEGTLPGLGWIDAETKRFKSEVGKIPHMGWNRVFVRKESKLCEPTGEEQRFYFVHSYYVKLRHAQDELLSTHYGHDFTSGFERDNILGVQFHPEKSHKYGMELLRNFAKNY